MALGNQIFRFFYQHSFVLDTPMKAVLKKTYPNIPWQHVVFKTGLPWFMQQSSVLATVLPAAFCNKKIYVYLKDSQHLDTFQWQSILMHEAYHIQQYKDTQSIGFGLLNWGFNRCFIRWYLAWYFQIFWKSVLQYRSFRQAASRAYELHPMEIPAFAKEAHFRAQRSSYFEPGIGSEIVVNTCLELEHHKPAFGMRLIAGIICLLLAIIHPLIISTGCCFGWILGGRPGSKHNARDEKKAS